MLDLRRNKHIDRSTKFNIRFQSNTSRVPCKVQVFPQIERCRNQNNLTVKKTEIRVEWTLCLFANDNSMTIFAQSENGPFCNTTTQVHLKCTLIKCNEVLDNGTILDCAFDLNKNFNHSQALSMILYVLEYWFDQRSLVSYKL